MAKRELRQQARVLRNEGNSVRMIQSLLGISRSSASTWTRDIILTPKQRADLSASWANGRAQGSLAGAETNRRLAQERRLEAQADGRKRAQSADNLYVAGCMLYWGEGEKGGYVRISNTDVALLQLFMRFLKEHYMATSEDFTLSLCAYLNNGYTLDDIQDYWLTSLELPTSSLRKGDIRQGDSSAPGRRHPYGVANLYLRRSNYILNSIYGAIQELSGVDNQLWQS
jgi:hypothetical protein